MIENLRFFENSNGLIIPSDNITNFDLSKLVVAHKNKASKCILTMLTFESGTPLNVELLKLIRSTYKFSRKNCKPSVTEQMALFMFLGGI